MKALILFYSYSGNTRKIAEMIRDKIRGDLAEIKTVEKYPKNYNAVVEKAKQEVAVGYEPPIIPLLVDMDKYDTIILGTPVWWYTFAPPLKTLLFSQNWTGKTVYSFATHGGGVGSAIKDIEDACVGAHVKSGLDIYFRDSNLRKIENEINKWIDTIKNENGGR